jgi:hypothetical protein
MTFTHTPAVNNHTVTHLPIGVIALLNGPCEIDTRHQRIFPDDGRSRGNRQRIFVVDGAVIHLNQYTRVGKRGFIDLSDGDSVLIIILGGEKCVEHGCYLEFS